MGIKNLKSPIKAIAFTLVFSLTGCSNQSSNLEVEESKKAIEKLQEEFDLVKEKHEQQMVEFKETKLLTEEEIKAVVQEIENSTVYWVSYFSLNNELTLKDYRYNETENYKLLDTEYSKMNLLLNQPSITTLVLEDTNFDFSNLDISSLEKIQLVNIKLENAKEIMQLATETGIALDYTLYTDIEETSKVINYVVDNNIACDSLSLFVSDQQELVEFCNLLEKVNAKKISFLLKTESLEKDSAVNINTKLNDNTSSFSLTFDYLDSGTTLGDRRLENIEIYSNNPSLSIILNDVLITENTKFSIPNNTSKVYLYGSHTDVSSFKDLETTSLLYYFDCEVNTQYNSLDFETYDEMITEIKDAHGKAFVK